jgi:diguanylate cyclase
MTIRLLGWLERHARAVQWVMAPLLVLMVIGVYLLVHATGGIKYVYSHSMYLPIVLAGMVYGGKGGVLVGILGGITLGPFMPIDVETGEAQETLNWLYRTGFFTLIGFFGGVFSDLVFAQLRRVNWLLRHDEHTGRPNRLALLESLFAKDARGEPSAPANRALVLFSLENSQELQSVFGQDVVHQVIGQLAERIESLLLPESGCVYRTSAHQIAVLTYNQNRSEIEAFIDLAAQRSRKPFQLRAISIHGDIRTAHMTLERPVASPESFLQGAEAAFLTTSQKEWQVVSFTEKMAANALENLRILGELYEALNRRQLVLYYQPKVAISTGAVYGVEGLLRWHHPSRGSVPLEKFIARAETSTLIDLLTTTAIGQALSQWVRWQQQNIQLVVAVNISPRNLLQPGFTDMVLEQLDRYGVDGAALELEITERALMVDAQRTIRKLTYLADARISISVDDFGTGYSSLQYLNALPISSIKLDQAFIRNLPQDSRIARIVEAIVGLAHTLDIKVVAEGVASQDAFDFLGRIGCDMAQGYHISPPLPVADLSVWLSGRGHQSLESAS